MNKKIYALILMMVLGFTGMTASAKDDNTKAKELTTQQQTRLQEIKNRVEEIQAMDKTDLSAQERKDLKKELNGMKKEAKAMNGGVYLSVGAIIIIILLLILIV